MIFLTKVMMLGCSTKGPVTWLPGDYAVGDIGLAVLQAGADK